MHVRCDNQYKTGADRGNVLGQPRLFECMGICVLRPYKHSKDRFAYFVRNNNNNKVDFCSASITMSTTRFSIAMYTVQITTTKSEKGEVRELQGTDLTQATE